MSEGKQKIAKIQEHTEQKLFFMQPMKLNETANIAQ